MVTTFIWRHNQLQSKLLHLFFKYMDYYYTNIYIAPYMQSFRILKIVSQNAPKHYIFRPKIRKFFWKREYSPLPNPFPSRKGTPLPTRTQLSSARTATSRSTVVQHTDTPPRHRLNQPPTAVSLCRWKGGGGRGRREYPPKVFGWRKTAGIAYLLVAGKCADV